jgi:hypothetical protein
MAFEKIYQFPDEVRSAVKRIEQRIETEPDGGERLRLRSEVNIWYNALLLFHQTVCATAKFRDQKKHCETIMRELEPVRTDTYLKAKIK